MTSWKRKIQYVITLNNAFNSTKSKYNNKSKLKSYKIKKMNLLKVLLTLLRSITYIILELL